MKLQSLPEVLVQLLRQLEAPPRLVAHLTLTHDAAMSLVEGLLQQWPSLALDREAVLFGAATHDLGKTRHRNELSHPGKDHEAEGEALLLSLGIPAELARFCRTHGQWNANSPLEDLLVALADTIWKGKRDSELEDLITDRIAALTHEERWKVYLALDDLLAEVAQDADARLAWQASHDVTDRLS